MNFNKNNIDVVIYHAGCQDGFASAFVVWYYYKKNFGIEEANNIKYFYATYSNDSSQELSNEILDKYRDKNIIMCDFSYPYSQLKKIIDISKSFLILDHHKTAKEALEKIPDENKIFDMNRSGCGITWDYFFLDKPIPLFLAYIQDIDIWTKKMPQVEEFGTYFYQLEFEFTEWEKYLNENNVKLAISTGTEWLLFKNTLVMEMIQRSTVIKQKIDDDALHITYCQSPIFQSDIGNQIFNIFPESDFSVIWQYDPYKDQTIFSLRSTDDRKDVSAIAKRLGGGGHRNAAGLALAGMHTRLPFDIICPVRNLSKESLIPQKLTEDQEEYLDNIIKQICRKISYFICEYQGKDVIVLYCNSPFFAEKVSSYLMDKYSFVDLFVIWNYDTISDKTYLQCFQPDNCTIPINLDKIQNNGFEPLLDITKIDDYDLLSVFNNRRTVSVKLMNVDRQCGVISCKKINENWLTDRYLDIIKRKYADMEFICFSTRKEEQFEYLLVYNDHSTNDPLLSVLFNAMLTKGRIITFVTSMTIEEVFSSFGKKNLDDSDEDEDQEEMESDYFEEISGETDEDIANDSQTEEICEECGDDPEM